MTPPPSIDPQAYCCATCDNEGDKCPIQKYIKHTKTPPSIPLMAAGILISGNCKIPFSCHSRARSPVAQQAATPFLAMASPELIALAEKEWVNRAERKQPPYDKRSWISGWFDGYFSKPKEEQAPATDPIVKYSRYIQDAIHYTRTIRDRWGAEE